MDVYKVWFLVFVVFCVMEAHAKYLPEQNLNLQTPIQYQSKSENESTTFPYLKRQTKNYRPGRFLSPDPVGFTEENPISFNRYAYANNNPYKYVDPDGEFPHLAIGAIVGGAISGISYGFTSGNNFSWGGLARETSIGAAVGAATAGFPALAAAKGMQFGGKFGKHFAITGNAFASGSVGDVVNQGLQGNQIDAGQALTAGAFNMLGMHGGTAFTQPAKFLTDYRIPAQAGYSVQSLSGKVFQVGKKEATTYSDETSQQLLQNAVGGGASEKLKEEVAK